MWGPCPSLLVKAHKATVMCIGSKRGHVAPLTFPATLEFDSDLLVEVLAQLSAQKRLLLLPLLGRGLQKQGHASIIKLELSLASLLKT